MASRSVKTRGSRLLARHEQPYAAGDVSRYRARVRAIGRAGGQPAQAPHRHRVRRRDRERSPLNFVKRMPGVRRLRVLQPTAAPCRCFQHPGPVSCFPSGNLGRLAAPAHLFCGPRRVQQSLASLAALGALTTGSSRRSGQRGELTRRRVKSRLRLAETGSPKFRRFPATIRPASVEHGQPRIQPGPLSVHRRPPAA